MEGVPGGSTSLVVAPNSCFLICGMGINDRVRKATKTLEGIAHLPGAGEGGMEMGTSPDVTLLLVDYSGLEDCLLGKRSK